MILTIVIYAEKPDQAKTIARSIDPRAKFNDGFIDANYNGNSYCVTWGFGHMCELQNFYDYDEKYKKWDMVKFPFFPEPFVLKLKSNSGVKKQYGIVKGLFSKAEYIINATDADQEGELIFNYIYDYMKCKKKWKRLWLHSTDVNHIKTQMNNLLEPSDVFNLLQAAKARSRVDQLVGFNGTALYSVKCGSLKTLGRVQTPTLNFIVEREKDILSHKKSKFWTVKGKFDHNGDKYTGVFKEPERFEKKSEAEQVKNLTSGKNGIISDISIKNENKKAPLLYDLATLQREANTAFGFSAKKTLDLAQSLYDKHYTTYPRTQWRGLPKSMKPEAMKILDSFQGKYKNWADKVNATRNAVGAPYFSDPKEKDSHYAIIPTTNVPKNDLTPDEEKLYDMIVKSFIRIFYPPAQIQRTTITTEVNKHKFITSGFEIINPGWYEVDAMPKDKSEAYPKTIKKGDTVNNLGITITEGETQPPKRFTDSTLIEAMENCGKKLDDKELASLIKKSGIGTPATRAGIIESLVQHKYIERKGKTIYPTSSGIALIDNLPVSDLKSAEMTANWEKGLEAIRQGDMQFDDFMREMIQFTNKICNDIKRASINAETVKKESTDCVGKCPLCGGNVLKKDWGCFRHLCTDILNLDKAGIKVVFDNSGGIKILGQYKLRIVLTVVYPSLPQLLLAAYPDIHTV